MEIILKTNSLANRNKAQFHCLAKVGNFATIISRKNGNVQMRYWNDGALQYISF